MSKTIPEISAAALDIINLFKSTPEGETVTYHQMDAAAGFSTRRKRGVIQTALHRVLHDDGLHFAAQRGVGYRRLTAAEAASAMGSKVRRINRAAKRGKDWARNVDVLEVPADKRAAFVGRAAICEAIAEGTSTRGQDKLAAAASQKERVGMTAKDAFKALLAEGS